jgi:hypothetical protein
MKLLFLLSATTASVAHSSSSSSSSLARQLIERHVQSDGALEAIMAFQQAADWSCVMKGAWDESSCEEQRSGYDTRDCSWCPLGSMAGACVSTEQADVMNGLEIPHVQCGAPPTLDDIDFWGDLVGCGMVGATSEDCLGNPLCAWCVVEDPGFGLCMSTEFIDEADTMIQTMIQEPEEEPIQMDDMIKCSPEPPLDNTGVTGLLDFNCVLEGALGKEFCAQGVDGGGNPCVYQDSDDFGELCLSATQTNVMNWFNDIIDNLDIDSLMSGVDMDDPYGESEALYQEENDYAAFDENVQIGVENNHDDSESEHLTNSVLSNVAHGEGVEAETKQNGGGRV